MYHSTHEWKQLYLSNKVLKLKCWVKGRMQFLRENSRLEFKKFKLLKQSQNNKNVQVLYKELLPPVRKLLAWCFSVCYTNKDNQHNFSPPIQLSKWCVALCNCENSFQFCHLSQQYPLFWRIRFRMSWFLNVAL